MCYYELAYIALTIKQKQISIEICVAKKLDENCFFFLLKNIYFFTLKQT